MSTFCTLPWNHLYVSPDGVVKTCCSGRIALGNINDDNIEDILYNERYTKIRKDFIEGKWPSNCLVCNFTEKTGFVSGRRTSDEEEAEIRKNPDKFNMEVLEYRWDKTCNLACMYCGPLFSTTWIEANDPNYKHTSTKNFDDFETFVRENSHKLKKLKLFGGEPLMMKKKNQEILENISDDTKITISTNLSIPNFEKNKIYNILKSKKNVSWLVSFENIRQKYEYVRYGADWNVFEKNLETLLSNPHFKVQTSSAYNVLSALDIVEFYEYCKKYENLKISWHGIIDPYPLYVFRMPKEFKQIFQERLEHVIKTYSLQENFQIKNIMNNLINSTSQENSYESLKLFLTNQESKLKKSMPFSSLWSELSE